MANALKVSERFHVEIEDGTVSIFKENYKGEIEEMRMTKEELKSIYDAAL